MDLPQPSVDLENPERAAPQFLVARRRSDRGILRNEALRIAHAWGDGNERTALREGSAPVRQRPTANRGAACYAPRFPRNRRAPSTERAELCRGDVQDPPTRRRTREGLSTDSGRAFRGRWATSSTTWAGCPQAICTQSNSSSIGPWQRSVPRTKMSATR